MDHPYKEFETEMWRVLASSIAELEENQDLKLMTPPEYVIGYLSKRLSDAGISLEVL